MGAVSDIDIRRFAANLGLLPLAGTPDPSLPPERGEQPDYNHRHEDRHVEDPQAWPPCLVTAEKDMTAYH